MSEPTIEPTIPDLPEVEAAVSTQLARRRRGWIGVAVVLAAALVVTVVAVAVSDTPPQSETTDEAGASPSTDPLTTLSENEQRIKDCSTTVSDALISASSGDETLYREAFFSIRTTYGIDSAEYKIFEDSISKVFDVGLHKGHGRAVVEAFNEAFAKCRAAYP